MANNLLRAASLFLKLSQQPIDKVAQIKKVVDDLLKAKLGDLSSGIIMVTENKVTIDLSAIDLKAKNTSRGEIEAEVKKAVFSINPSCVVEVTASISSEETLPKAARLRKNFAKFHKLAQDPLAGMSLQEIDKGDISKVTDKMFPRTSAPLQMAKAPVPGEAKKPLSIIDPVRDSIAKMILPYGGVIIGNQVFRDNANKQFTANLEERRSDSKLPAQPHVWLEAELKKTNMIPQDWKLTGYVSKK